MPDKIHHSRYLRHIRSLKKVHRQGLRWSSIRYLLISSILKTPPCKSVETGAARNLEVHVLCYWKDYLQAVWALKTFHRFARSDFSLVIHIDGFATHRMIKVLTHHFPNAWVVTRQEADRIAIPLLAKRGLEFLSRQRAQNVFVRKMVDFHVVARSRNILVLDSDVLFFREPTHLLDAISGSNCAVFMRDCAYCYSAPAIVIERFVGAPVVSHLNAGLGLLTTEALDFQAIEKCLRHAELTQGDATFLEQTLYAIGLARSQVRHLPSCYLLSMEAGLGFGDLIARHYAGDSRGLMLTEGMMHLIDRGFLRHNESGACHE